MKLILGTLVGLTLAAAKDGLCESGSWSAGFGLGPRASFNAPVEALVEFDGCLIAGGRFTGGEGRIFSSVARRVDGDWKPLGDGLQLGVRALLVHHNRLIAGGSFVNSGNVSLGGVAQWDGMRWTGVGNAPDGVNALAIYDGDLVAAGEFPDAGDTPALHVAAWDGSTWRALGAGIEPVIHALAVYNGLLFAAGESGRLYAWDGVQWSSVPFSDNAQVRIDRLAVIDGEIFGAGYEIFLGTARPLLIRWNGDYIVRHVGASGRFSALAATSDGLLIGGDFEFLGLTGQAMRWKGPDLDLLPGAMDGPVYAFAEFENQIFAAGAFTTIDGRPAGRFGVWIGGTWCSLEGMGLNGNPATFCFFGDLLIAGGGFTKSGPESTAYIAGWDGWKWNRLGSGMNDEVWALTEFAGNLIAGGSFTSAGGVDARKIARWDGSKWHDMGAGFDRAVYSLAVVDGDLYAGGAFENSAGREVNHVARWTGSEWIPLGAGVDSWVLSMVEFRGDLAVGGFFDAAGGLPAPRVAFWNGEQWRSAGTGFQDFESVQALCVQDDRLVAGGRISAAGGVPARNIIQFDGFTWTPLGEGLNEPVYSLCVYRNSLYAGGRFIESADTDIGRIGRWDGISWRPVSSIAIGNRPGISVTTMIASDRFLFVGGDFNKSGGLDASRFARFEIDQPATVPVRLVRFTATRDGSGARIRWALDGEITTAVFRLWRSAGGGPRISLGTTVAVFETEQEARDPEPPEGTAEYWLQEFDREGGTTWHGPARLEAREPARIPLAVTSPRPNPFRERTAIDIHLAAAERITIRIIGVQGSVVRTLLEGDLPAGTHTVIWDGIDDGGSRAAVGVYVFEVSGRSRLATGKVVHLH